VKPQSSDLPPAGDGAGSTVVLVVFGLCLLALAGWMGWEFYSAWSAFSWPTTEGVVRKGRVKEIFKTRGNQYQTEVEYEYTVDGHRYTGDTFNTRNNYINRDSVASVSQEYREGARCSVHYNPSSPSQSVLVPELTWHAWGKLAISVLSLLGAVGIGVVAFRKPNKQRPRPFSAE
jgi:Protein of unknown function (DUF3592)